VETQTALPGVDRAVEAATVAGHYQIPVKHMTKAVAPVPTVPVSN